MSRDVTAAADAKFQSPNVPTMLLVSLHFDSGVVRITNLPHNKDWNGDTYIGLGRLVSLESMGESGALEAVGISLSLSGVPPDMLEIALAENYQGRPAKVWVAALDDNFNPITDPVGPFVYRMDTMPFKVGTTATIQLNCESRLVDLARPRVRRYNDSDQRAVHPNDASMKFVEQMVEKELVWGRS